MQHSGVAMCVYAGPAAYSLMDRSVDPIGESPQVDDPQSLRKKRRAKAIETHRAALERFLRRIERRKFAQDRGAAPVLSNIALLRWAGAPEELIRALEEAGAASFNVGDLLQSLITRIQVHLARDIAADQGCGSVDATVARSLDEFLDTP